MVSKDEMIAFFRSEFPKARYVIEDFTDDSVMVRHQGESKFTVRGTVSGPTMMALADTALYVALLREIGLVLLMVTTSLNFNFLRKPVADWDLLAECRLLKRGKSLAVGEVSIVPRAMRPRLPMPPEPTQYPRPLKVGDAATDLSLQNHSKGYGYCPTDTRKPATPRSASTPATRSKFSALTTMGLRVVAISPAS